MKLFSVQKWKTLVVNVELTGDTEELCALKKTLLSKMSKKVKNKTKTNKINHQIEDNKKDSYTCLLQIQLYTTIIN